MRFALSWTDSSLSPVMFPPGRASVEIHPTATASPEAGAMMIGMVVVARLAASVDEPPCATITSILSRTSSAASSGSRSSLPSAKRASYAMLRPSTYPSPSQRVDERTRRPAIRRLTWRR